MDAHDLTIEARGQAITLMPERTALWDAGVLFVADLHLGKAQSFQASGIASPCTLDADLGRLSQAIARTNARTVIILGDLIHDTSSITSGLCDRVAAWRSGIDCELILTRGNHDRHVDALPSAWGIESVRALRRGPFLFTHAPTEDPTHFVWCGHVHPVCLLKSARDRLRLPCFAIGASVGILPSFGALTGGAVVRGEYRRYAVAGGQLVEL